MLGHFSSVVRKLHLSNAQSVIRAVIEPAAFVISNFKCMKLASNCIRALVVPLIAAVMDLLMGLVIAHNQIGLMN